MSDQPETITTTAAVTTETLHVPVERRRRQRAPVAPSRRRTAHLRGRIATRPVQAKHPHVDDIPEVMPGGNRSRVYLTIKRLCDIVGALTLLVLLSPVMLVTTLVLAITTRGKPIFAQERLGFCARPFRLYKFRTMVVNAASIKYLVANEQEGPIFKNSSDPRVTRLGRFLRSFSIDETPQLINVLQGHMSLVGPRPPLEDEVREYEPWQRQRLAVKPGLTCLWQVSGRSEIGFVEWMRMDIWYLDNQGLTTDLNLLIRTPLSVITRRGAY